MSCGILSLEVLVLLYLERSMIMRQEYCSWVPWEVAIDNQLVKLE